VLAAVLIGLLLLLRAQQAMTRASSVQASAMEMATTTVERSKVRPRPVLPGRAPAIRVAIAQDGMVEVPQRYRIPGVERVHSTATGFQEWLNQYPTSDRQRIRDFNTRYNGVYLIASPEQIAWMAENGYPMPEDLIAVQGIDDQTLRNLADHGNDKAGFLLHDRNLDRLGDRLESQLDLNSPDDRALNLALSDQFLESPSAFKGYVEAADAFKLNADPGLQKTMLVAGLTRAASLGDSRASDALGKLVDQGLVTDDEFGIATRILIDFSRDRVMISGEQCPRIPSYGPIPTK
jgi:hypothetical protein